MISFRIFGVALAGLCTVGALSAQTATPIPPQREPVGKPLPARPDFESRLTLPVGDAVAMAVPVIPSDAMSDADKQLAVSAQHEIRRRSTMEAMGIEDAGWSFVQLACPAFPHSLLLRYSRGERANARSMFSAVIARGDGRVRIVPIQRRGYSLFSPAPVNAMTIGAMNAMLDREDPKPAIGAVAVCYAALTGAAAEAGPGNQWFVRLAGPPFVTVDMGGGEGVSITTAGSPAEGWDLEFGRKGRLVKAAHVAPGLPVAKVIPRRKDPAGKPVPSGK